MIIITQLLILGCIINHLGESHPQLMPQGSAEQPKSLARAGKLNSALGWGRKIIKLNSALGWGRNTVKLNSALGQGGKIIGSTKISCYVIIGIDPSVYHGFGPDLDCRQLNCRQALGLSWYVCSLGLDQPMTDLGILFLKYKLPEI